MRLPKAYIPVVKQATGPEIWVEPAVSQRIPSTSIAAQMTIVNIIDHFICRSYFSAFSIVSLSLGSCFKSVLTHEIAIGLEKRTASAWIFAKNGSFPKSNFTWAEVLCKN